MASKNGSKVGYFQSEAWFKEKKELNAIENWLKENIIKRDEVHSNEEMNKLLDKYKNSPDFQNDVKNA